MQETIDLNQVKKVFPYGQTSFEVCRTFSTVYRCAVNKQQVTACNSLLHRLRQDEQADPCVCVFITCSESGTCVHHLQVVSGGLCCQSGVAIAELGDKNDDMLIAVAAVTVGY